MPTLIMQLQALLDPLTAGGAWYAINTSEPPIYPYAVFQRITSPTNVSFEGPSDLQSTLVQVDVYSRLISEADALGSLIAGAFAAWSVPNVAQSSQDFYEAPVKAFRVSQDFMVWSAS